MLPIVTPEQMKAIDEASPVPQSVLIQRAGGAVARSALRMMGGAYGRTVNVIVGSGNNGADGRVAAGLLRDRGVKVRVYDVDGLPIALPPADLVIDAAYGTGFRGRWDPPEIGDTPVLAVDIPSGVNATTGSAEGPVLPATRTVTFAALKMGVLLAPGSDLAGELELADIGLHTRRATAHLVQADDVARWWPVESTDHHKWRCAVRVIAGNTAMTGAPSLVAAGALRSGSGMVQVSAPGMALATLPVEAVQRLLPSAGWAEAALGSMERFHAAVIGPGLGRTADACEQIRRVVAESPLPLVVDGDALFALAWSGAGARTLLHNRRAPTVLTPHDGEYQMLAGEPPIADRLVAARRLAADTGCVVLLKGPTTVIADPKADTLVVTAGDERLATAGTGDVLAGVIGRLLAGGVEPFHAAAAAAWVHGRAAERGARSGFVASDLPSLVPALLDDLL
jgi:ADP-dependent NAD(P)H-hydrate dehydratase / NAD(P)H-hydrate epimerase